MSYITVTFIIFALFLSPYYQPTGIEGVLNILSHYIIPIAFIIEWFLTESDTEYEWSYIGYWMIYPFIYLTYVLIRGYLTGLYPYYFIDLNYISIITLVLVVIALTVFFFLLGSLYITLNRKIYNAKIKKE